MASGIITDEPHEDAHYDLDRDGDTALYVGVRFDALLHPDAEGILSVDQLRTGNLGEFMARIQHAPKSGLIIPPMAAAELETAWAAFLTAHGQQPISLADEVTTPSRFFEGATRQISVNIYERNPYARQRCIEHHGCRCAVCGFDFEAVYGEMASPRARPAPLFPVAQPHSLPQPLVQLQHLTIRVADPKNSARSGQGLPLAEAVGARVAERRTNSSITTREFRLGSTRRRCLARYVSDVTAILQAVEQGDSRAASELLPLVYEELRKLAALKLAHRSEPQTLQATALVHEAWLRLSRNEGQRWTHRRHFFAAAAQAMRHILVDNARRKARLRHGGDAVRVTLDGFDAAAPAADENLLQIEEALVQFESTDPEKARVVVLKFYGGMTNQEVAEELGVTERTVERYWAYAKVWLLQRMRAES